MDSQKVFKVVGKILKRVRKLLNSHYVLANNKVVSLLENKFINATIQLAMSRHSADVCAV